MRAAPDAPPPAQTWAPILYSNKTVLWCAVHRRPFTLAFGRIRAMDPSQKFNEPLWRRYMRSAANKVNALVWVLK